MTRFLISTYKYILIFRIIFTIFLFLEVYEVQSLLGS